MKTDAPVAQVIIVTFKNGTIGRFVGPAVLEAKDGLLGRIGIEKVSISPPIKLDEGVRWDEVADGVPVLKAGTITVTDKN